MHEPTRDARRTRGAVLLWLGVASIAIGGLVILAVRAEPRHGLADLGNALCGVGVALCFGILGLVLAIIGAVKRWTS
jgi:hypothetical protein